MKKSRSQKDPTKYTKWYGLVRARAMAEAVEHNAIVVIGHTHHEQTNDNKEQGVMVINLPDRKVVEL